MSGVLKKACWLLPVLFVVSPVLAQQGGGIQSAANIESAEFNLQMQQNSD